MNDNGPRGYIVYSRRGRFFCIDSESDPEPRVLGCNIVNSIPRDLDEYESWLLRCQLSEQNYRPNEGWAEVDSTRPISSLWLDYSYEIDLDTETFWINGYPMFRLDCMPSSEAFLKLLSRDHYGHYIPTESTPHKHRWIKAIPPPVSTDSMAAYMALPGAPDDCHASWQEVLGGDESLSSIDHLRLRVLEVFVGSLMRNEKFASRLFASEVGRKPTRISHFVKEAAVKLVLLAFRPLIFHKEISIQSVDDAFQKFDSDYVWARPEVCIKAAFHLDDEETLRTSIGDLVGYIHGASKAGLVYGILCSISHCVLVKVDTTAGGKMTHTSALEFFPSRLATSPSTPGLTSVFKLASRFDHSLLDVVRAAAPEKYRSSFNPPSHSRFDNLPTELKKHIASFLTSPLDLLSYGSFSATKAIATLCLTEPSFYGFRLLSISSEPIEDRWDYGPEFVFRVKEDEVPCDGAQKAVQTTKKADHSRLCAELFLAANDEGRSCEFQLNSSRQYEDETEDEDEDEDPRKVHLFKMKSHCITFGIDFLADTEEAAMSD